MEAMNEAARSETSLMAAGLRGFYDSTADIAYTLMRIAIGSIILMHGWVKVKGGAAGVAAFMAKSGLEPGIAFAYAAMFLETVGAVCIILGLFTRLFAAALAIEMAIAFIFVHGPKGFAAGQGGFEYVLLLGIVFLVIAIRGGGPYSVDRVFGNEL
jgi:putative oxidoreductase